MDTASDIGSLRFLPLLAIGYGIVRYFALPKGYIFTGKVMNKRDLLLYGLVAGVYALSMFRTQGEEVSMLANLNETTQLVGFSLFIYGWISRQFHTSPHAFHKTSQHVLLTVFSVPGLFIVINIGCYLLGITKPVDNPIAAIMTGGGDSSVLASLLGLNLGRTGFYLTGQPNGFAIVVGAIWLSYVFAIGNIPLTGFVRVFVWIVLAAASFGILLLDSRGTMGEMVLTLGLFGVLSRLRLLWISQKLIWVIPFLSFFVTLGLQWVATTSFGAQLSRSEGELATGNNRGIIWKHCIHFMSDPTPEHVLGYGQNGHMTSGAVMTWARELNGWEAYTHSFLFQTFFDMGYLGIASILLLLSAVSRFAVTCYESGYRVYIMLAVFPVYYLLSGIFEATIGLFNHLYTLSFFLLTLTALLLKNEWLKQRSAPQAGHPTLSRHSIASPSTSLP